MSLELFLNNTPNHFEDSTPQNETIDENSTSNHDFQDHNNTYDIKTMISRINRLTQKEKVHILNILKSKTLILLKMRMVISLI